MQLKTPTRPDSGRNPARARGLKRAAATRAPCEPAAWTPMPAPVSAVHLLALLTRVRADQVAAGQISAARLNDVRAYKCVAAELGYLYRLAHGGTTGGTIVTSMAQLVQGLARLHPAWRMDGDKFADRDRHHSAVRRRLRALQAMGLLHWRVGVDVAGEDARTELELLDAPRGQRRRAHRRGRAADALARSLRRGAKHRLAHRHPQRRQARPPAQRQPTPAPRNHPHTRSQPQPPHTCFDKFGTPLRGSSYVGEQQRHREFSRPAAPKRLRRQNRRDARERKLNYQRKRRAPAP